MKVFLLNRSFLNLAWSSAAEFFARVLGVAYLVALARYLHPDSFGEFNLLVAYFGIAVVVGNLGLDRVALRDLSTGGLAASALQTILALRCAAALLSAALLSAAGYLIKPESTFLFIVLGMGMLPAAFSTTLTAGFHARERFGIPGAALTVGVVGSACLILIGVQRRATLEFFVWGFVFGEAIRALWLLVAAWQAGWLGTFRFDRAYASYAVRAGVPYGVLAVLGMLYLRIDLVMLDLLVGGKAVADYAAAYRILDTLVIIPALSLGVMFPRLARLQKFKRAEAAQLYLLVTRVLMWVGAGMALTGSLVARPLLTFLFGAPYAEAASVLTWLMLALLFLFWHGPNGTVLYASEKLGNVVLLSFAFAVINVLTNLLLIPWYAATGAAAATAISAGLVVLVFTWFVCRRLEISLRSYIAGLRSLRFSRDELKMLGGS